MTTIAQERSRLAAVGLQLITREQTGFRFDYSDSRPVEEPARTQHVHITITNPGNYASDFAHARAVEAIGISRFPTTGVSYNRLVMQSGLAFEGQPIGRRGAHTVNDFQRPACTTPGCPGRGGSLQAPSWNNNITGRAYVICQNVDDVVTDRQLDSLARCIAADRLAGFVRLDARIHGHRCCSSKSCPGNRMWARMGELAALVAHYLRVGLGGQTPAPEEDDMPYTEDQLEQIVKNAIDAMKNDLTQNAANGVARALDGAQVPAQLRKVLLTDTVVRRGTNPDGTPILVPLVQEIADTKTGVIAQAAEIAGLRAAVAALAAGRGVDPGQIQEAVEAGVASALARVEVVVGPDPA
jgi:hypothetical protein